MFSLPVRYRRSRQLIDSPKRTRCIHRSSENEQLVGDRTAGTMTCTVGYAFGQTSIPRIAYSSIADTASFVIKLYGLPPIGSCGYMGFEVHIPARQLTCITLLSTLTRMLEVRSICDHE